MESKDVIETHLTVENPCSVPNYEEYCLNELRRLYMGKCYRGKYIESIEQIIDRSSVIMNAAPLGTANMSVKFEAKTISYPPGFILLNCVVSRVDQTRFIMLKHSDNAGIYIKRDVKLLSLKPGNIINVKVGDARYPILSRSVGIKATPYIVPDSDENIYHIDMSSIADEELNYLKSVLITPNDKISDKLWTMFYTLYYPYKKQIKPPSGAKLVDFFKLPSGQIYIQRPSTINEADNGVYVFDKPPDGSTVIEESAFIIIDMFIKRNRNHIRLLEEMCAKFSKEADRKKNKAVWLIHDKFKKDSPD